MMTIKKTSTRTIHEMRCDAYIVALEADGKPFCSALPTKNKFRFFSKKLQKSPILSTGIPGGTQFPTERR